MLEECELEYRMIPVNIGRGDQFKPDFLEISPNNRMPAIVDHDTEGDAVSVFESGAILLYLAEKTGRFMSSDLIVRKETLEWLFWQVGGLGPMAGQISHFVNYAPAEGNEYSFDLGELANYYLDYKRIMDHWVNLFPSEIFEVQYEDLVMDQERVSRRLIEYLGLDWDDNCLEFYKNKRAVNSFSSLQVRQPIYAHSINRWKDYEEQLAPLIEILPRTSYEAAAKFEQAARR